MVEPTILSRVYKCASTTDFQCMDPAGSFENWQFPCNGFTCAFSSAYIREGELIREESPDYVGAIETITIPAGKIAYYEHLISDW